ncbi:hypothetical protein Pmani_010135 [Petrolisthes manimaculis]|uniref:Uncharacterized protein n=1 Tax=Petrolisthes manimaculis TaxID=1843537 RepID=A0AAE1Q2L8_9EUCA|nr:hypothetical protein Pmani_010135 [Petrolisthes manimaculis]
MIKVLGNRILAYTIERKAQENHSPNIYEGHTKISANIKDRVTGGGGGGTINSGGKTKAGGGYEGEEGGGVWGSFKRPPTSPSSPLGNDLLLAPASLPDVHSTRRATLPPLERTPPLPRPARRTLTIEVNNNKHTQLEPLETSFNEPEYIDKT